MSDFDLRYREGLPLVLKQINCDIKPGEKVTQVSLVEELFYESRFLWVYWGDKPTQDVEQEETFVNETGRRRRFIIFSSVLLTL